MATRRSCVERSACSRLSNRWVCLFLFQGWSPNRCSIPKRSGVLISRVPGRGGPDRDWDERLSRTSRSLFDELAAIDLVSVADLPQPRSWCGEGRWSDLIADELLGLLDASVRTAVVDVVAAVLDHGQDGEPPVPRRLRATQPLVDQRRGCGMDRLGPCRCGRSRGRSRTVGSGSTVRMPVESMAGVITSTEP